ncbi:histidine phosphatase family protein [Fusibacter ferrireducens]|uniref:Histidine phosphatase family protein n=1 Tax=Fusibacter ferrireducens TaxID=2785058 RepID=A0ABR9ZT39_9FIRM|nr:histidine phosphatase family protein [Fusibacter ferrireducens]MBF4693637.1 histidine phosphatase family protein [Fusibacter ferrireducens]
MLEIYMARHGQTEWNVLGRMQGWLNSPLTESGIQSAHYLGREIRPLEFDAYYSSPSNRALNTLQIATNNAVHITCDDRLREIGLGSWQGMLSEDIEKKYPKAYREYYFEPEKFKLEDGENYHMLYKRVDDFVRELLDRHFEANRFKRVMIVTHGVTLMMLRLIFNGDQIHKIKDYHVAGNAKLHIYKYDGSRFKCLHEPTEEHLKR